jgi:hypothetical protein
VRDLLVVDLQSGEKAIRGFFNIAIRKVRFSTGC